MASESTARLHDQLIFVRVSYHVPESDLQFILGILKPLGDLPFDYAPDVLVQSIQIRRAMRPDVGEMIAKILGQSLLTDVSNAAGNQILYLMSSHTTRLLMDSATMS